MSKFSIGMFGAYNEKKFKRDFRDDFFGLEICLFENEEDIDKIKELTESKNIKYGIHFPLRAGIYPLRDPQFLTLNEGRRNEAYKIIENELNYIHKKDLKPEYILFHFPKPAILKESFNLENWRFYDRSEYCYEDEYSFDNFKNNVEKLFKWLLIKSREYNFTPVLELDALNKYITDSKFLEELLEKYNEIKLCLDTGRLHAQHINDKDFNEIDIIKRFSKYTKVIHLWNVQVEGGSDSSHYPALPTLREEDGWAPIEKYLNIIKEENRDIIVLFEHRSEKISDEELESCYQWIRNILR